MFSVQGWSLSAADIKAEVSPTSSDAPPKAKKRKRSRAVQPDVTNDNIADLWKKVIENKDPESVLEKKGPKPPLQASDKPNKSRPQERKKTTSAKSPTSEHRHKAPKDDEWAGLEDERDEDHPMVEKPKKKKQRSDDRAVDANALPSGQAATAIIGGTDASHGELKKKKKPERKLPEAKKGKSGDVVAGNISAKAEDAKPLPPASKAAAKLTPLQASMREKLISARFRHLNETLYTRPSTEAFRLFEDAPEMFSEYHEGFRRQVDVWPENPVDVYIAEVRARGRVKDSRHHHHQDRRHSAAEARGRPNGPQPLPRTASTCTIADLGCGDAALAAALQPLRQKLRLDIRSFDLQSPSPLVIRADMANLPLADGAVDVAIFCLALMGTNWLDFVEEAYRVLRWKGELWVAEIKSRFAGAPGAARGSRPGGAVVEHSVGNQRKKGAARVAGANAKKGKGGAAADAADNVADAEEELAVEVDGVEDSRKLETDVSAFVAALKRRGFVLRGEPSESVDQGNKMFVKMYFVKAATPTKGKGVAAVATQQRSSFSRPPKKKFISADEDEDGSANEPGILKPCVYKLR